MAIQFEAIRNTPPMWQCPHCDEQHDDSFHACWKCGTNAVGERDPDSCVSEPVQEQDQAPDSADDQSELLIESLPTVTYFSVPPCVGLYLAVILGDPGRFAFDQTPEFAPSLFELVVTVIAGVLIGVPYVVVTLRYMFFSIMRRQKPIDPLRDDLREFFWPLVAPFRLPESFWKSHRWFVPVYYGSLAAVLVVPVGAIAWNMIQMM